MIEQEKHLLNKVPRKLLLGGEWLDAEDANTFEVLDPSTGEMLCAIADATPRDGLRALAAATEAQARWAATAPRVRSDILNRCYQLVLEHVEDLALLMTLEMGKPVGESRAEVKYGAEFIRWFAEEAVRISGRYGSLPEGTGTMIVTHKPVGPCLLITPWNFPLAMATRKISPALAAGCTVVIKPAALTPLTTLLLAALFEQGGVPAGVINVVTTSRSSAVCSPIIADRRLRKLSFTGSTSVGKALIRQSADNVLRTSMELGGNAPFLVFEDCDLEQAVNGAMAAKFRNMGQACTAANRFLVHESVAQKFAQALTERVERLTLGRGTDPAVTIGPLIDQAAVEKTHTLVNDAVSHGARLLIGGNPIPGRGNYFEASVLTDVNDESRIFSEEIFGPVVSIIPFASEQQAVQLANASEYGLAAYVYTNNLQRARRMIEAIDTGMMGVNAGIISNVAAPFGGIKQSGLGREGGVEGIQEYLDTKYTMIPDEVKS